jgi:antirestriction protein ArdC
MHEQSTGGRADLFASITSKIIAALEAGPGQACAPWSGLSQLPSNALTGRGYRGINTLLLWLSTVERGYSSDRWATFRQWKEAGYPVRAGEKSTTVVFWKSLARYTEEDEAQEERPRVVARAYSVFNAAQVEGYSPAPQVELSDSDRITSADQLFAASGIRVRNGSTHAYYQPSTDEVHMPEFDRFRDVESFYAVLAHECVHATGAAHRLNRDLSGRFASERYAMEELVAELGAAFICGSLGISAEPRADHAIYIASWLRVLKADSRAIVAAASQAQQASDWLYATASEACRAARA